jgi:hypothetical protein
VWVGVEPELPTATVNAGGGICMVDLRKKKVSEIHRLDRLLVEVTAHQVAAFDSVDSAKLRLKPISATARSRLEP